MEKKNRPKRFVGLTLGIAAALAGAAVSGVQAHQRQDSEAGPTPVAAALTPQRAMLWKYTARCALRADQELEAPGGPGGANVKFKGALGLAPEWRDGRCDARCQETVSSCLFALTNPTGHHVKISLLSAAPSLATLMSPNETDLEFPFQEGAFFGNVFGGQAYVCHGRDADKGEQLKRLCALDPALCSGLARFADAGRCEDSCEMACSRLSDGTDRCVAARCTDPTGRVWDHPITTYMRNRIEAGNADAIKGAEAGDMGLARLRDGGQATYRRVDFGRVAGTIRSIVANVAAPVGGGRIEVWLDGRRRLGVLLIGDTGGAAKDVSAPLDARGVFGPHDVILRFASLDAGVRLTDIALR